MTSDPFKTSKRVLEPIERISEMLFGLIMVVTFTGSLSVADAGRDDVRTMLLGALGCNLAWGIIDAVLYLLSCLAERAHSLLTFRALRATTDSQTAQRLIKDSLPSTIAGVLQPEEVKSLHERLQLLPDPPEYARLRKVDWIGALGVFLLVFLATFPVAIPFILMKSLAPALLVSNVIAITMLFMLGLAFGRAIRRNPVVTGFKMVVLGCILVALTKALEG